MTRRNFSSQKPITNHNIRTSESKIEQSLPMIHQDNTTTKYNAVLIEPDMNEQPVCKKQKTCAQNDLAEALLDLRKCSIPPAGPLFRPSLSLPCDTPRRLCPVHVVLDDSTPISDDEEDSSSIRCRNRAPPPPNQASDSKPQGRPSSTFNLPFSRPLPIGRPLPPAPRFPRCAPARNLNSSH